MTDRDKHFGQKIPNNVLVVDDQNSNHLLLHRSAPRTVGSFRLRRGRKIQQTSSSLSQLAFESYVSMMACDDAIRDTHAQSCPFRALSGAEGIEDFLFDLARHADASMLNLDLCGLAIVGVVGSAGELEDTAFRHGINCVRDNVDNHVGKLRANATDDWHISEQELELDLYTFQLPLIPQDRPNDVNCIVYHL